MTKVKSKKLKVKGMFSALVVSLFTFYLLPFTTSVLAQEDATSSVRDIVREKVKEKLDSLVAKNPMAAAGTLTQITDHSFEVKTALDNKTQLVSAKDDTKYFQFTKRKKKEVKFEDLTLGQFILAMGFKNSSQVLEASRIVGYDQSPLTNSKKVFYGKVTDIAKSGLALQNPKTNQTQTVKVAQSSLENILTGDTVIAIGKINDKGVFEASTVKVVSSTKVQTTPKPSPTSKPTVKPTATPAPTP